MSLLKKPCDYDLPPPRHECVLELNHEGVHLVKPLPLTKRERLSLFMIQANIWLHVNLPTFMPIIDRFLHLFGICSGH